MPNALRIGRIGTWLVVVLSIALVAQSALAQDDSGFKYIEIKVVGPDGQPVADVEVEVSIDAMAFPMATDDEGMISLNVSSGANSRLSLSAKHDEYVADVQRWRGGKSIPEKYTLKLEQGVAIGGIVHNPDGEPIEGVQIRSRRIEVSDENVVTAHDAELATTDAEGRWKVAVKEPESKKLQLQLVHENYLSDPSPREIATWDELQDLDHVLVMERGLELKGTVTDVDGNPIEGAVVFIGQHRYENDRAKKTSRTDEDGRYVFHNVQQGNNNGLYAYGSAAPGSKVVTVAAEGWMPDLQMVQVTRDMEPVDFQLQQGKTLEFLVVDVDDQPIEGARVVANQWRNHQTLPQTLYDGETDENGIWKSDSMPADPVYFSVNKNGYMQTEAQNIAADGKQHKLVMNWPLVVTGRVVDAESGLPLDKFDVIQGIDWGNGITQIHWERFSDAQKQIGVVGVGKYRTEFTYPRAGHLVRIEAEGYRPGVSRIIQSDEVEVTINFEMEEGVGPVGTIKTPDGKPAVGAEVLVATSGEYLNIYNGNARQHEGNPAAKTNAEGKYQLPFVDPGPTKIICRHESGYAQLTGVELEASPDITLQAWSAIEGKALRGDQPLVGESIQVYFQQYTRSQGDAHVVWSYSANTDAAGKFQVDRVIAGQATVSRLLTIGSGQYQMSAHAVSQQVALEPGKTAKVQLGGEGRAIFGRIKAPESHDDSVKWDRGWVQFYQQAPPTNAGSIFERIGRALAGAAPQPQPAQPSFRRNYAAAIDAEGKFEAFDIVPGRYRFSVQLYPPAETTQNYWQPIGTASKAVTIPEKNAESDQDPFDAGEFTLQMVEPPNQTNTFRLEATAVE